jgi:hypothetical protein
MRAKITEIDPRTKGTYYHQKHPRYSEHQRNTGRLAACWAVATAGLLPPCRAHDGTTEGVVIWTMAMKDREEMREKENQPNTKKK